MVKTCKKCWKVLPLSSFYKHKRMADGHLNSCIECVKATERKRRQDNIEHWREYDRERAMLPHRVEARKFYQQNHGKQVCNEIKKKWNERNVIKRAANLIFNRAIKRGAISRSPCLICGKKAHAHHPDYDRPLEVVWLCPMHHKEAHKVHL